MKLLYCFHECFENKLQLSGKPCGNFFFLKYSHSVALSLLHAVKKGLALKGLIAKTFIAIFFVTLFSR
jgi:hypothetical protein